MDKNSFLYDLIYLFVAISAITNGILSMTFFNIYFSNKGYNIDLNLGLFKLLMCFVGFFILTNM